MSASTSTATPAAAEPVSHPVVVLFARGVWSIFHSWPVMRAAVSAEWGGSDSKAKRTWFLSLVVDEFEERWQKAGSPLYPTVGPDQPRQNISPPDGVDLDELADLLFDIFLQEFDVELEDGSPEDVARKLIAAWSASLQGDESVIKEFEEEEARVSKRKVEIPTTAGDGDDDSGTDGEADDDEDVEMVEQTEPRAERVREEPEVDDDGFTMVKGKGKKR